MSQRGSLVERQSSRSLWCLLASLLAAWISTSQATQSAASSAQHITAACAFSHTSHWIFISLARYPKCVPPFLDKAPFKSVSKTTITNTKKKNNKETAEDEAVSEKLAVLTSQQEQIRLLQLNRRRWNIEKQRQRSCGHARASKLWTRTASRTCGQERLRCNDYIIYFYLFLK